MPKVERHSTGGAVHEDLGMGKVGGRFVIILDIERVLSVEEINAAIAGAADAAAARA